MGSSLFLSLSLWGLSFVPAFGCIVSVFFIDFVDFFHIDFCSTLGLRANVKY